MNHTTRRDFLQRTLETAITGLAGISFIEAAKADEAPRRNRSANDKIRIAVIGLNGRGMDHIAGYLALSDVEITALCDPDMNCISKAQAAIEKKGKMKPQGFQDIRKLLEEKDIDAVSIATPNHWHSLAGIWAMQQGKDVYVEKPVSHNVHEGRVLVEVSRKTGRICQAGTQSRSHKACQDAITYIKSGKIGKVTLARGLCYKRRDTIGKTTSALPIPAGVDYDLWVGPAPLKPIERKRFHYDWHWFWDYGNGDLGNQGIHQMDIARWALGKNSLPNSVMSVGGRFSYVDDGQTPNTELSFYDYSDSQLIFEVRGLKTNEYKGASVGNIIYGSDGYVVIGSNYGKAAAFDNNDQKLAEFSGAGDHFANFIDAVKSRKREKQHADILDGHLSSALCHLGNISYRLGAFEHYDPQSKLFGKNAEIHETLARFNSHLIDNGVKLDEVQYRLGPRLFIDPKHETFRNNPEANAMLTREYRAGFVVPNHA